MTTMWRRLLNYLMPLCRHCGTRCWWTHVTNEKGSRYHTFNPACVQANLQECGLKSFWD